MAGSDLRGVGKSSPIPVVSLLISSSENKENTMDSGNKETSKSESEVCLSLEICDPQKHVLKNGGKPPNYEGNGQFPGDDGQ